MNFITKHYYRCKRPKLPYFYHPIKKMVMRIPTDPEEAREMFRTDPFVQSAKMALLYTILTILTVIIILIVI